ncbi:helix-turn-helix domain-containing protein [Loigolactobacillus bifermentans]|uniref:helix-turn-helix domain-containing protein n=1 Tax=Loigolactobacillus bifermentans TaxID=1607 RepID=UPI00070D0123|nr:helix-turn-helix transcriptional regulator [Loigolactobacillus bifermentans]QGG59681.1 helix-turn-helix domain-containing protein [Loigolactobacillus bifermentans]
MTTFDRINELAKKQGLSLRSLAQKSGLGETTIYGWKNRTPDSSKLESVAKTLNVTVDYLLGNKENDNPKQVDIEDKHVIMTYQGRPIPEEDMEIIKRLLRGK